MTEMRRPEARGLRLLKQVRIREAERGLVGRPPEERQDFGDAFRRTRSWSSSRVGGGIR
ncbi:hypothetical protein ABZ766_15780 [Streptomyces sp. NPDC006670]|uniref:hypothetical protein n=1 Tax=Streptomyces sp. NPDC006670 TaxID=3154476 RepID=UPI00340A4FC4